MSNNHKAIFLSSDRDEVLDAVSKDGFALEYVSEELRNDRDIVYFAVKQTRDAIQYASEELQQEIYEYEQERKR